MIRFMTIQVEFISDICDALDYERYPHHTPLIQRRIVAMWLNRTGLPHAPIAQLVGRPVNTRREYWRLSEEGGVEKLNKLNWSQPGSAWDEPITAWEASFRDHPPASVKEAQRKIEELTGIQRVNPSARVPEKTRLAWPTRRQDSGHS